MNTTQFIACLQYVSEGMIASEPRLTALDQVIGDGDHGIGIKRGLTRCSPHQNLPPLILVMLCCKAVLA